MCLVKNEHDSEITEPSYSFIFWGTGEEEVWGEEKISSLPYQAPSMRPIRMQNNPIRVGSVWSKTVEKLNLLFGVLLV